MTAEERKQTIEQHRTARYSLVDLGEQRRIALLTRKPPEIVAVLNAAVLVARAEVLRIKALLAGA